MTKHRLRILQREATNRGRVRRDRERGSIPAALYGGKESTLSICFDRNDFEKIGHQLKPNHLSTTFFQLEDGSQVWPAIIKEIQYHPVSYSVLHVDFLKLSDDRLVTLRVPLDFLGVEECAGVKQGGFLRQVIRSVKVRCLPRDIPSSFSLDVRDLGIKQSLRLREIDFPAAVSPLAPLNEVAVVVSKR